MIGSDGDNPDTTQSNIGKAAGLSGECMVVDLKTEVK